jgi:hypothetical protein
LLATLVADVILAIALLMSLNLAASWGEMAGIPAGGDKSALGGLFAVLILMLIRWGAVVLLLWLGIMREAFAFLPAGRWTQVGIVLGGHLALGAVSYFGFNAVANGLTVDNLGPQKWSPLFGILLPLPALLLAGWAVNRDMLVRHPRVGIVLAMAMAVAHLALFRQRLESMRRPHAARAPVEQSQAST